MELIINGDKRKLRQLIREIKNTCKRDKLSMSISGDKVEVKKVFVEKQSGEFLIPKYKKPGRPKKSKG
jgi:hypothetical protein